MTKPQIQYASAPDGVNIAYWTLGEGGMPLVLHSPLAIGHCALEWEIPGFEDWYNHLARSRMIVRYDLRGTGMSQRGVSDLTAEAHARDIGAVVGKLGLQRFDLLGFFVAGSAAVTYAAEHPERVNRLALWASALNLAPILQDDRMSAILSLVERDWVIFTETFAHAMVGWSRNYLAHQWAVYVRESLNADDGVRMVRSIAERDFTPLLSKIAAPTLILYYAKFPVVSEQGAMQMASALADSRVVRLEEDPVTPSESKEGIQAIDDFLQGGVARPMPPASRVVTVLFTDLTASTTLTQRLGDEGAQTLVREHNAIVREALVAHEGSEIKHTGDGIMASFPAASRALECAIAIQNAIDTQPNEALSVHIGLNAGEPVSEDGDLFGTAVQLARRICDTASGGEIMASDVVRQLAAGKGFLFADRGVAPLKGFDDPIRLYEVRWREDLTF